MGGPSSGNANHLLGAHAPTDVYTEYGNPVTSKDCGLYYYEAGRNISLVPDAEISFSSAALHADEFHARPTGNVYQ